MTHTAKQAPAVTIATATYEASSLLNTHPRLPQPRYVTAQAHYGGTAAVDYQMATHAAVLDWAAALNIEPAGYRIPRSDGGSHNGLKIEFPHPMNPRITVQVYAHQPVDPA